MRCTVCTSSCRLSKYKISRKFCWGNFDRATSFSTTFTNNNIFTSFGWITLSINSNSDMWFWCIKNQHSTYLRSTEQDVLFKQPQNSSPKKSDSYRKRVKTSESLKCQLTKCEKNQNIECQSEYIKGLRPGWLALRKLWHSETTPFKKFMTNLRKWKKAHLRSSLSTVHSETEKATETKHKRSFVRVPSFAYLFF